jgi:hypothetical protein
LLIERFVECDSASLHFGDDRLGPEYLLGTPPGFTPCMANPVGASQDVPGYIDIGMLHEIMHTFGFVATCAPHKTPDGHVSDSHADLMYRGPAPWDWERAQLDVGRDDYYKANISGCLDLAMSAFLEPATPGAVPPPGW